MEAPENATDQDRTNSDKPEVQNAAVRKLSLQSAASSAAALGALCATLFGGTFASFLSRSGRKKREAAKAVLSTAVVPPASTAVGLPAAALTSSNIDAKTPQLQSRPIELSPVGSPVGSTPVRLTPAHARETTERTERTQHAPGSDTCSDADEQSDNSSVRDQRQNIVDAAQLQKVLKHMQDMAEENRKLSAFLQEYKADAEKLSHLEAENRALRDVTSQLETELRDLKTNTLLPGTGAELEAFKNNVRISSTTRSMCSGDETLDLGISTASVDGANPDSRVRRSNVFKQLIASLQRTGSASSVRTASPRIAVSDAGGSGAGGSGAGANGGVEDRARQRSRAPRPEEAAEIGHAVYQLLDQFGGRMF